MNLSYKYIKMKYIHTYIYIYIYTHINKSVKVLLLSHVQLFATPWTGDLQIPLTMGFSMQEYQSG